MIARALLVLALLWSGVAAARELPAPTVRHGEDRWGGHTVERHVGRSDAELRTRLARDTRLDTASTFDTLEIATHVIESTLAERAPELVIWLARAPPGSRRVLAYRGGERIGRAIRAGDLGTVLPMRNARLVIEALGQGRWHLITAYPNF